jgi:L-ribulose-5-phosphate 3-epimerase
MLISRRGFLHGTATGLVGAAIMPQLLSAQEKKPSRAKLHIGSCMINLDQAKQAGLEGAEIKVGDAAERLAVADPKIRAEYKQKMKETGLVIPSFMMGLLNTYPLASDPRGPAWLQQSIDAAKDLGDKVILVAFFGKGSLGDGGQIKQTDVDSAVQRLKAAAPRAKDAGVILALENMLTAKQNAEILDRVGSDAVKVYYDVGNTTGQGYDVPAEIRFLKDRIASFHFKDNPKYLGEGKVQFPAIAKAIEEIGYQGWIVLETTSPSKDPVADAKRNAAFVRKLFGTG